MIYKAEKSAMKLKCAKEKNQTYFWLADVFFTRGTTIVSVHSNSFLSDTHKGSMKVFLSELSHHIWLAETLSLLYLNWSVGPGRQCYCDWVPKYIRVWLNDSAMFYKTF